MLQEHYKWVADWFKFYYRTTLPDCSLDNGMSLDGSMTITKVTSLANKKYLLEGTFHWNAVIGSKSTYIISNGKFKVNI